VIIFDHPVGIEVPGELQRFAVFIPLTFISLTVFALLFQLIVAQGAAGGLDQPGIHGNALVYEKPLLLEGEVGEIHAAGGLLEAHAHLRG
jgi:hypothetical protein